AGDLHTNLFKTNCCTWIDNSSYYIDANSSYHASVVEFFKRCRSEGDDFFISTTTWNELRRQDILLPAKQKEILKLFLRAFDPISPEDRYDRRATNLRRFVTWMKEHHRKTHCSNSPVVPALADAQICVVGLQEQMTIATHNVKDFSVVRFLGLEVYNPVTGRHYPPIKLTKQPPYYWDIAAAVYI
ncbi:hypothetical protein QWJ34_00005, partial [Saccharibacillus sp. CPCC 101409]|uniref:type II toxin-antitoxin system VapC family toxin n=1 Tax=Saccharibacillus sp. CPCC 101409 TaxID=3058041 RepID=UPI0026716E99